MKSRGEDGAEVVSGPHRESEILALIPSSRICVTQISSKKIQTHFRSSQLSHATGLGL